MHGFHRGAKFSRIRFTHRNDPLLFLIESKNPQLITLITGCIVHRKKTGITAPIGGGDP